MKTFVVAFFILIPSTIFSQDSIMQYRHLMPILGANKEKLFERAKAWFNETSMSSKFVLEKEDGDKGELKGKGIMTFKEKVANKYAESKVTYDIIIKIANTGYLYTVSNFTHEFTNNDFSGFGLLTSSNQSPVIFPGYSKQASNDLWSKIKEDVSLRIEPQMDRLKVDMKNKVAQKER